MPRVVRGGRQPRRLWPALATHGLGRGGPVGGAAGGARVWRDLPVHAGVAPQAQLAYSSLETLSRTNCFPFGPLPVRLLTPLRSAARRRHRRAAGRRSRGARQLQLVGPHLDARRGQMSRHANGAGHHAPRPGLDPGRQMARPAAARFLRFHGRARWARETAHGCRVGRQEGEAGI